MEQTEMASLKAGLVPYFQPIVEISTGSITAFEVLARYETADAEATSAAYIFTDPRLSYEVKRELDRHVRKEAIRKAAKLPFDTRLTLNISPELVPYVDGCPAVHTVDMLEQLAVPTEKIVIELVETNGQISDLKCLVKAYRDAGLRIAVDDFGAGFSDFDRVIELAPDVIKLDMRLLKKASKGGTYAAAAMQSIVDFCAKSGAVIVVEGVETEEEFFYGLGCGAHYMQGFLFSKAVKEFFAKDTFTDQIKHLRKRFFERSRAAMVKRHQANVSLMEAVNALRDQSFRIGFMRTDMEAKLAPIQGLLRFYLTDFEGNQVSPNYVPDGECHFRDEGTLWQTVNWSWRPYFCKADITNRAIISDEYLDMHSGKLCKTLAVRLGSGQVLLVDVEASQ